VAGPGGLACKALCGIYAAEGLAGLERLSGNFVILVHDGPQQRFHLVTDCCGMFPAFECSVGGAPLFGSHPDVLAAAAGETHRTDPVSLAEFAFCGTVTPPYTYYERIRALDVASTTTLDLSAPGSVRAASRRHFDLTFAGDGHASEQDLAAALAAAIRKAVVRRTQPLLGLTAVGLSGGLDSRAILAAVEDRSRVFAFCCYDAPNAECRTAAAIARALNARFVPIQRGPEYYGENAEAGVRISGAMGTFANNHFLGVVPRLQAEGAENMLTGCYCDYLFKGLPLNRRAHWLTGRETLAPFTREFYFSHFWQPTPLGRSVRERWEARFPAPAAAADSDESLFQVEVRRTFPLCYEGDNQQRVVPQRVTGWYVPVADRDVLDVYRRIPPRCKLNRALFLKVTDCLCGPDLRGIRDANTAAPITASPAEAWACDAWRRLRDRLRRMRPGLATPGSWPDWHYYAAHSRTLARLWARPNPEAASFFRLALGEGRFREDLRAYMDGDLFLFVQLLTLKLWFDQRT
jgi:asparagine synthase (glutamine-hydrolysing)